MDGAMPLPMTTAHKDEEDDRERLIGDGTAARQNGPMRSTARKTKSKEKKRKPTTLRALVKDLLSALFRRVFVSYEGDAETRRIKLIKLKLHPPPDRGLRRVASRLSRRQSCSAATSGNVSSSSTSEALPSSASGSEALHNSAPGEAEQQLARLRRKGDEWTARDLWRFQCIEEPVVGGDEETVHRVLCHEWLERVRAIPKKYGYLAWLEDALYTCYWRLGGFSPKSGGGNPERWAAWRNAKRDYAEMMLMGRRIWRRASHASRQRVLYHFAMLCTRFADLKDETIDLFLTSLRADHHFSFSWRDELPFLYSVELVQQLEAHLIQRDGPQRRESTPGGAMTLGQNSVACRRSTSSCTATRKTASPSQFQRLSRQGSARVSQKSDGPPPALPKITTTSERRQRLAPARSVEITPWITISVVPPTPSASSTAATEITSLASSTQNQPRRGSTGSVLMSVPPYERLLA